ncbi:MAG: transposase [Holosporales bacterium]|jgi:transposase|nr:transposase [Holosporales bacterium]
MTGTFENFIGIDVAKKKIDVFCSATDKYTVVENAKEDIKRFFQMFKAEETLVVMENSGGYESTCIDTLLDCGFTIHRANNNMTKSYITSFGQKAKTDKIDARGLSDYGRDRCHLLEAYKPPSLVQEKIRELALYLAALKADRAKNKNRLQSPGLRLIKDNVQQTLESMDKNILDIQKEIEELIAGQEDLKKKLELMCQYKGVGKQTAINLLACLPELGEISGDAIAALAGLVPYAKESGQTKKYSSTRIGGRHFVRSTMFMASLSAIRYNRQLSDYYEHLLQMKKKKMVALVAVMRKMIVHLNAILRDGYVKEESVIEIDKPLG